MRKGIPGRTWLNGVSEVMGTERFHILSSQGPPLRPMPARGSGHREQGAELKPGIWVRVLALPLTCRLNLRLFSPALLVLLLLLSFAASSPSPPPHVGAQDSSRDCLSSALILRGHGDQEGGVLPGGGSVQEGVRGQTLGGSEALSKDREGGDPQAL